MAEIKKPRITNVWEDNFISRDSFPHGGGIFVMLQRNDVIKFLMWLMKLELAYKPAKLTDEMVDAWYQELKHLDTSQMKEICSHLVRHCREFPKLPDILDLVDLICINFDKNTAVDDAVAQITNFIGRYGYTGESEAWTAMSPLSRSIVDYSGGWSAICRYDYKQLEYAKKTWKTLGENLLKNPQHMQEMREQLIGPPKEEVQALPEFRGDDKYLAPPAQEIIQQVAKSVSTKEKLTERFKNLKRSMTHEES